MADIIRRLGPISLHLPPSLEYKVCHLIKLEASLCYQVCPPRAKFLLIRTLDLAAFSKRDSGFDR